MDAGTAQGMIGPMSQGQESEGGKANWAESAFEELYLENYPRIVAVLFRLVGERARAEELANEVFWKAYRRPMLRSSDGNVGGWLYRTATNLGIDALRARGRRLQYERVAGASRREIVSTPDPLDEILREEKRARVRGALASLKPDRARILVLRHSGLSYKELAEALGVKLGSVGTLLIRAESEFQKHYMKLYGSEEGL